MHMRIVFIMNFCFISQSVPIKAYNLIEYIEFITQEATDFANFCINQEIFIRMTIAAVFRTRDFSMDIVFDIAKQRECL